MFHFSFNSKIFWKNVTSNPESYRFDYALWQIFLRNNSLRLKVWMKGRKEKSLDELTVFQSFGEFVMKNKCLSTFIGSARPSEVIQNYWSANQNNFVLAAAVSLCCCFYILPPLFLRKCRFKLIAPGILRHLICPNLCSTPFRKRLFKSLKASSKPYGIQ